MSENGAIRAVKEGWRPIVASILLAKAAIATFSIAPFLLGGYIDSLGLTVREASQVLSAEIFALALTNASAFFWIDAIACRRWARNLLLLLVVLNLACAFSPGVEVLLLLRALVGGVEGMLLAIGFGLLGATQRPSRNFGLYFAISLSVGAANVQLLPLFIDHFGVTGLFVNLSAYATIALCGSVWVERGLISEARRTQEGFSRPDMSERRGRRVELNIPRHSLFLLMVANFVYFVGQGGVWSFLERLGTQRAINLVDVASALSLSLIAGVAGGLTASWLDLKLGRIVPMFLAIAAAIVAVLILLYVPGYLPFVVAACLFNYGNNFGHPYILGYAAKIDTSARFTVLSGALQTGGQASGPLIAGFLVTSAYFDGVLWLGLGVFIFTVMLLAPIALSAHRSSRGLF